MPSLPAVLTTCRIHRDAGKTGTPMRNEIEVHVIDGQYCCGCWIRWSKIGVNIAHRRSMHGGNSLANTKLVHPPTLSCVANHSLSSCKQRVTNARLLLLIMGCSYLMFRTSHKSKTSQQKATSTSELGGITHWVYYLWLSASTWDVSYAWFGFSLVLVLKYRIWDQSPV